MKYQRKSQYIRDFFNQTSFVWVPEKKICFIRIPKNGSTTMVTYLDMNYKTLRRENNKSGLDKFHKNLKDIDVDSYTFFAVVRNPIDRFVSTAAWFKIEPNDLARNFKRYVEEDDVLFRHTRPQSIYMEFYGQPFVDDILNIDTYQRDFINFCELNKLRKDTLLHRNKSSNKKLISPSTIRFIEGYYASDFKYIRHSL